MTDYEKLGAFYLGRSYDLEAGQARVALLWTPWRVEAGGPAEPAN